MSWRRRLIGALLKGQCDCIHVCRERDANERIKSQHGRPGTLRISIQLLEMCWKLLNDQPAYPVADPPPPAALTLLNANNWAWWLQTITQTDPTVGDAVRIGSERRLNSLPG
jgi:hypothetical protein